MKIINHKIDNYEYDIIIGQKDLENWQIIDESDEFDLWFHIDNLPSSHVIIRQHMKKGQDINYFNEIITLAADYCKQNSKYKNKKNKIIYTNIGNLKKGKEVGSVLILNAKLVKNIFI
jgi:predicted ribosome quality control (RQC) complex YloA/Tae2 family protein